MLKESPKIPRNMEQQEPNINASEDADIVANALANTQAFAAIVTKYQEPLHRYMNRLGVRRQEDAEDLLQTVFLKCYRNLRDFDQRLKFSSWLYRIAHNEAVSFFRAKHIRPEGQLVDDNESALAIVKSHLDIERDVNARIDADRLRIAMDALPPKYRDVLILRFFEERDYADISDILQVPMGTVATLLNRAKKRLREIITKR